MQKCDRIFVVISNRGLVFCAYDNSKDAEKKKQEIEKTGGWGIIGIVCCDYFSNIKEDK